MTLKTRLALSIFASLIFALIFSGAVIVGRAEKSVRTEMTAAMTGGRETVSDILPGRPSPGSVVRAIRSFDGQRHIQAILTLQQGGVTVKSALAVPRDEAPDWFEKLIALQPLLYARAIGWGTFTLRTDARSEISEVWEQAYDAFAAIAVMSFSLAVLLYLLIMRPLRALSAFSEALTRAGEGRFDRTLRVQGPEEFAKLARKYNAMADRLAGFQSRNEQLHKQIVTVQDEERAGIARDLHDEVGPYLFSIKVDAASLAELPNGTKIDNFPELAQRISDSAQHIQNHVRAILRQLAPGDHLDLGLDASISELFAFWQERDPALHLELIDRLPDPIRDHRQRETIYRIVQESLSNAVRHGAPKTITVSLDRTPENHITVSISDDGRGLPSAETRGSGIAGMAARLRAIGGSLTVENRKEVSGVVVTAILPAAAETIAT